MTAQAIFVLAALASPPSKHSLILNTKVGAVFNYEMTSGFTLGGEEGSFSSHYEMAIASLSPKGTVTFKTTQTKSKFVMRGKESGTPSSVVTAKMKLTGEMISVEPAGANPDQARTSRVMQYVVPAGKVGKGQKWTWSDAASKLNGNVPATGSGQCLDFATRAGVPCARLRIEVKETAGKLPASSVHEVWLSLKDGMIVDNTVTIDNAPFGPGRVAKMKMQVKRV